MKNFYKLIISMVICHLMISNSDTKGQIRIGETIIDTTTIVTNLKTPWEILWGADDHIWITEREGRVSRLNPENGTHTIILTIPGVHEESESGLLGMAHHPDFPDSSYVYLVYTYMTEAIKERIVRYTWENGTLNQAFVLLENIPGAPNHNGSRLVIDQNYKLFITTGDALDDNQAQNLNSLNGKVLRINLDGSIPDDNPFPGSLVWSWGHRNAQGLIIAPDGNIYSSEHGPNSEDELNLIEKERNYGWPDVNGFCDNSTEIAFCTENNVKEPLFSWTPTLAVAGIAYYPHNAIPEWKNNILMANLKAGRLETLQMSSNGLQITGTSTWFQDWFGRLRDVCVSPDGSVFLAVSNRDGRGSPEPIDDRIIRIKASDPSAMGITNRKNEISIYPNPMESQSLIRILSDDGAEAELTIYDLSGKLVFTDNFFNDDYTLTNKGFKPGYHIVKVRMGSLVMHTELIIL